MEGERPRYPSGPPGFECLTSFQLKRIHYNESQFEPEPINIEVVRNSLGKKPWILFNQCNVDQDEQNSKTGQPHISHSSESRLPKGVIRGCPSCSDCQKVIARWHPDEERIEILEEVPVFHPTEEEFRDTIDYVASIRSKVEPYGICRIVPPPGWVQPSIIKESAIWEGSKFISRVQQIAGLRCLNIWPKVAQVNVDINAKRESSSTEPGDRDGYYSRNLDKSRCVDYESFAPANGPEFTLKSFKKYADDFKSQYFNRESAVPGFLEPTLESIEGDYRRIVENPSEEIEVLHGHDLCSSSFGSGFPEASNTAEPLDDTHFMRTGWNLNILSSLPNSLLAYETPETCHLLLPRLQVGMCFSSQPWRVEEHHLYSLCYMHDGAPKILYSIPGSCSLKFEAVMKKHYQSSSVTQPEISSLKSESVPVYRCVHYPGEFVLVLPGAYRSAFDSGFNCTEEVNFAPLDWLSHGHNVVELYRGQRRKTSLSHDKILLGAAQDAVKAHWLSKFRMKVPDKLLKWRDKCNRDGALAHALKLRAKWERLCWDYLATSLETRRMDTDFDASRKKECCICFCDLHLTAVGCVCSTGTYSCLSHAKQLCSCSCTRKFALFRYEIDKLDTLAAALEGKLSSVHKWATEYLGLGLHEKSKGSMSEGRAGGLLAVTIESEQNERRSKDAARPSDAGKNDAPSIIVQPNTHAQSNFVYKTKLKEIANSSAAASVKTANHSSLLPLKRILEATDSFSESSSSGSDVELI